jgi:hypothetical protein
MLEDWVANTKLSLRLEAVLMQFLTRYAFVGDGFIKKESNKEISKEDV